MRSAEETYLGLKRKRKLQLAATPAPPTEGHLHTHCECTVRTSRIWTMRTGHLLRQDATPAKVTLWNTLIPPLHIPAELTLASDCGGPINHPSQLRTDVPGRRRHSGCWRGSRDLGSGPQTLQAHDGEVMKRGSP